MNPEVRDRLRAYNTTLPCRAKCGQKRTERSPFCPRCRSFVRAHGSPHARALSKKTVKAFEPAAFALLELQARLHHPGVRAAIDTLDQHALRNAQRVRAAGLEVPSKLASTLALLTGAGTGTRLLVRATAVMLALTRVSHEVTKPVMQHAVARGLLMLVYGGRQSAGLTGVREFGRFVWSLVGSLLEQVYVDETVRQQREAAMRSPLRS